HVGLEVERVRSLRSQRAGRTAQREQLSRQLGSAASLGGEPAARSQFLAQRRREEAARLHLRRVVAELRHPERLALGHRAGLRQRVATRRSREEGDRQETPGHATTKLTRRLGITTTFFTVLPSIHPRTLGSEAA